MNKIIEEDIFGIVSSKIDWKRFANKRVLVSGASGFLAAYIVETLLKLNDVHGINVKVTALVRSKENFLKRFSHQLNNSNFTMLLQDVTFPIKSGLPYEFIIHAASQASPKFYGVDPVGTLLANSLGTINLLNYAKENGVENFLFISSGEIYGIPENPNDLVSEKSYGYVDPMDVRSCYAESKRMGETMTVAWSKQYDVKTNVIRPFHTYGPGMDLADGRVFADFVADVVMGRDIILKSDGLAKRPFCYIADAVEGIFTVLLNGVSSEAYNLGNPNEEISIKDLAKLIANLFPERNIGVRFNQNLQKSSYLKSPITRSCPSIEKIKRLGWSPTTCLEDGFRRTINSFLTETA